MAFPAGSGAFTVKALNQEVSVRHRVQFEVGPVTTSGDMFESTNCAAVQLALLSRTILKIDKKINGKWSPKSQDRAAHNFMV